MGGFLRQQHVKSVERRRKLVRRLLLRVQQISLVILVWSAFIGCIYGVYQLVFVRSIFTVKTVDVQGQLSHITESEIKELAGIKAGSNLFAVDLKKISARISGEPWVREAAVARKLPSTIWIYVNEHVPAAVLSRGGLYLVGQDGSVFKEMDGSDEKDLPVLTGAVSEEELKGSMKVMADYMDSRIADYFGLSEVNFDPVKGYSLVISDYGISIRLGFDRIPEKLDSLYSMMGAISSYRAGKMRYVDLNIPGKVVVKYEG